MTKKIIYTLVAIIIVLVVVVVGVKTNFFGLKKSENSSTASVSGYSAVFLSNGQVYFGKLSDVDGDWMTLNDIYYLQVDQKLQPKDESTDTSKEQPKLSLVKLGNELHGPTDEMVINSKHVLFYEKLKDDGKVVQSISKYLEEKTKK